MNLGETIKTAREQLGLTQEDLAEKCEVSRQAVSKWELGASVPSPENLELLADILGVDFDALVPEGTLTVPAAPKGRNPWKIAALALAALMAAALLSIALFFSVHPNRTTMGPVPPVDPVTTEPVITGTYFFEEDGTPLNPDLGDGWCSFAIGQRVYLLVDFQSEDAVHGVSLFATPTGTETYNEREQLAVQSVYDRAFALFPLEFPEETMLHLDITLECDGGQTITETLNVTAVASEETPSGMIGAEGNTNLPEYVEEPEEDGLSLLEGPEWEDRNSPAPAE